MEAKDATNPVKKIKQDQEMEMNLNKDPMEFLEKVPDRNPMRNNTFFLTMVIILGCVLIIALVLGGMILFEAGNNQTTNVPEFLLALGALALGGLVCILLRSPLTK